MGRLARLLRNRDVLFCLALMLGLSAGQAAVWTGPAVLPALAVVMTLSSLGIRGRLFRSPRDLLSPALAGLILPYLLLGSLLALAGLLFRHDRALWNGFVLLAAVPSGVAVIPFTDLLDGDREFSLLATVCAYLAALVITPFVGLVAWGAELVSPTRLLSILLQLVVLPIAASRLLIRVGLEKRLVSVRGPLTNWSFFVVIYTIVGGNRSFLLENPQTVAPLVAVGVAASFGLAVLLRMAGRRLGFAEARVTSLVLLGTLKNFGLAGGLALTLFSSKTALPAVVAGTVMIPYIVWLGRTVRRAPGREKKSKR